MSAINPRGYSELLADIKKRIRSAQYEALKAVNVHLIQLYWDIGKSIVEKQQQTGWGKSVVENLAKDLQDEFPGIRGFSAQNLWLIRQFYEEYQGKGILQPLIREIGWAHHTVIMSKCKDVQERQFYALETKKLRWGNESAA